MTDDKPARKRGAYRRKDAHRCANDAERARSHQSGNPSPEVEVNGVGVECDTFFSERGFKPSISKILQTKGVVIGAKVWVSRKQSRKIVKQS